MDHHEDEDDGEEVFGAGIEGPSGQFRGAEIKMGDHKANAMRSKHSVTEQRRRSKINERFRILRDLVPHGDQKRDTASFLLEVCGSGIRSNFCLLLLLVIEYVQYLQEKVQKHEGSFQGWNGEPAKFLPWRNSHWRVPDIIKEGPDSGKCDEEHMILTPNTFLNAQKSLDFNAGGEALCNGLEQPSELDHRAAVLHWDDDDVDLQRPASGAQSSDLPVDHGLRDGSEELVVEGGTISISSAYSEELLNALTQSLQAAGVDLSDATISVQISLGKQANQVVTPGNCTVADRTLISGSGVRPRSICSEDIDPTGKRLKI